MRGYGRSADNIRANIRRTAEEAGTTVQAVAEAAGLPVRVLTGHGTLTVDDIYRAAVVLEGEDKAEGTFWKWSGVSEAARVD